MLAPGIVKIHKTGEDDVIAAVHSGFAEILPDKVTLLAEIAEWPNEIDKNRAEAARQRAEERLAHRTEAIDVKRAEFALRKALVRIDIANKIYLTEIKFTGYNIVPKPFYGVDFS